MDIYVVGALVFIIIWWLITVAWSALVLAASIGERHKIFDKIENSENTLPLLSVSREVSFNDQYKYRLKGKNPIKYYPEIIQRLWGYKKSSKANPLEIKEEEDKEEDEDD